MLVSISTCAAAAWRGSRARRAPTGPPPPATGASPRRRGCSTRTPRQGAASWNQLIPMFRAHSFTASKTNVTNCVQAFDFNLGRYIKGQLFRLEPDGPLGYAGNRQRAVTGHGSPCRKCRTDLGGAVQVDPVNCMLIPPETKHLKLKCDTTAFNFASSSVSNLTCATTPWRESELEPRGAVERGRVGAGRAAPGRLREKPLPHGRGLHSSTFRLNVSAVRGIGGALRGCLGDVQEVLPGIWGCFGCIFCQERLRLS